MGNTQRARAKYNLPPAISFCFRIFAKKMSVMKKLPIGIIRSNNYLYVDKTEHLYRFVTAGKYGELSI
jgi:hypothetical protein